MRFKEIEERHQEWLESFADKIRIALHGFGYEEQEGDEGEEDIVRSLVSLVEECLESGHVVVENIDHKARAEAAESALEAARGDRDALQIGYDLAKKERDEARAEVERLKALGYPEMSAALDRRVAGVAALQSRLALQEKVIEAAKDVLAVRGKDFERNPLPAYMERPFAVLAELIAAPTKREDRV